MARFPMYYGVELTEQRFTTWCAVMRIDHANPAGQAQSERFD
jgi:hypothetical protein